MLNMMRLFNLNNGVSSCIRISLSEQDLHRLSCWLHHIRDFTCNSFHEGRTPSVYNAASPHRIYRWSSPRD